MQCKNIYNYVASTYTTYFLLRNLIKTRIKPFYFHKSQPQHFNSLVEVCIHFTADITAVVRIVTFSDLLTTCFYFYFRPKSGSMLLYSRKKVRYRRDGYCWKKRKDGKTTREDHMKLKVQGTEVSFLI